MIRILFICHGNICRSTMAEFVMKDLVNKAGLSDNFAIDSAATSNEEIGNDVHPGTKRTLEKHGVPYGRHRARRMTSAEYADWDYIIAMDEENLRGLASILGHWNDYYKDPAITLPELDTENKIKLLMEYAGQSRDVADPWYTGNFDATWNDVYSACNMLLEAIL
ncbi:MAG: low molecular weight phosphotyrosine protein phosphatase [Firmicutes bacterium]|nr:low molecular weight phosphotyrosine protein phosphatase [Bacillota bacterium]